MLLTIHNLPSHMQYANVRLLIQSQCGIEADDMILDNLVNEGRSKKVTVGLVGEKQAEILKRKINGILLEGQQLYVKDQGEKQAGNEKRNRSSGYQKNDSPSQWSQAQQSQQGYSTNSNQYQPNYGQGNEWYMSQEQMLQKHMMMMNPQMRVMGGMGFMPPQNPHMDYSSGQMQSAIAPQYSNNQQEQNVDSAKKNDRSASTTKNRGRDDYDDYIDRYQNKGDGDRGDSRNFDRDDEYNNRYPDDQHAFKNNDRAMNERSRSWADHEESYQNYSSNQANRPPWDTDRERLQRSYYQSGRDSRSRSRSPYYYEDRERAVSRDRYQDTGKPDSSYQRKDSAYTAVASTSRQYGGDDNYSSQGFNYVDMYEPASECYYPKSSDIGNQSGNRWDQSDNPLPQSRYRWDKRDKPSNPSPQSGNRWDKPDNPLPQSRDAQPQGDRWDEPNNPSPQNRGAQLQRDRWDEPNNPLSQSRGAQMQRDRWDEPNNPSSQSRSAQPQGDRWGKSSTSQPREPQRPAPPKRNSPQPIIWEDHCPSSVKGKTQPLVRKPVPPPSKQNAAPHQSFKSQETLNTSLPKNKRNNRKSPFITPNMKHMLNKIHNSRKTAAATIADEMCKALPVHALLHYKRVRNSVRKSVYVRIELLYKNEAHKGHKEIIRRYREKFPTSTDRQILEACYKKIAKKPLAPETVPTSTDQCGAASTSVEETTKVEPVEVEVSLKPNEPKEERRKEESKDTPINVKADVAVDKKIKLETPAIQNIPKKVTPVKPVVPQIFGKLPKYPNGNKQTYKDNKKLAAKEFEVQSGYALDPVLRDALEKELAPIKEIFLSELRCSNNGEEAAIIEILSRKAVTFGKCLKVHVTKRLLDIRTNLILRVFVHGKTPHPWQVENLLRQYGVISLKKSVKQGPLYYVAECADYKGYDMLCEIGSFLLGTETTLMIKPFHIAGPIQKPLRQKNKGKGKGKWRR